MYILWPTTGNNFLKKKQSLQNHTKLQIIEGCPGLVDYVWNNTNILANSYEQFAKKHNLQKNTNSFLNS